MHLVYTPQHNSYSCLIVHTLSAPIHFLNSTSVFGHRAIVIWGTEIWLGRGGGVLEKQPDAFKIKGVLLSTAKNIKDRPPVLGLQDDVPG